MFSIVQTESLNIQEHLTVLIRGLNKLSITLQQKNGMVFHWRYILFFQKGKTLPHSGHLNWTGLQPQQKP